MARTILAPCLALALSACFAASPAHAFLPINGCKSEDPSNYDTGAESPFCVKLYQPAAGVGRCKLDPSLKAPCFATLKPESAYNAFNLNLTFESLRPYTGAERRAIEKMRQQQAGGGEAGATQQAAAGGGGVAEASR